MPRIIIVTFLLIVTGCGFIGGDDKMNLILACKDGDIEKVRHYLDKVVSPNFISLKGDTPLNTAIYNRHLDVIEVLIASGASCSLKDEAGEAPLALAKKIADSAILNYLESKGGCK